MKLTWYGTASVMLESDGYRIVFDPFLRIPIRDNRFRRQLLASRFRTADTVLVTHGHFDHILDIPQLYKNSFTEIYATRTPCLTLMNRGLKMSSLRWIEPGDSFALGNFTVHVYQGRHCKYDLGVVCKTVFKAETFRHPKRLLQLLRLNKKYPENGETLFYEIEVEGKRIQLMGSMGMDMDTDYPKGADVLILPFQGTGDPSKTVAPMIEKLRPKSIYLDHYDDAFPPMSTHVKTVDFAARMKKQGIPTVGMLAEHTYEI